MRIGMFIALTALAIHSVPPGLAEEGWADLSGRIVCDFYEAPGPLPGFDPAKGAQCKMPVPDESLLIDKESRGLQNALVWVVVKPSRVHLSYEKNLAPEVVLDVKDCRYSPHIVVVWFDRQKFVLTNSDNTGHAPVLHPGRGNPASSVLLERMTGRYDHPISAPVNYSIDITCAIHPWEKAYGIYVDNPYYALTKADGTFEIKNLPTGDELKLRIWHERFPYYPPEQPAALRDRTVTLDAAGLKLDEIRLSKSDLK
jgi:hypothetical protein